MQLIASSPPNVSLKLLGFVLGVIYGFFTTMHPSLLEPCPIYQTNSLSHTFMSEKVASRHTNAFPMHAIN